jgi:hypothetical protein
MTRRILFIACLAAAPALAGDNLPPFYFSDQFYLANGINPATLVGRPNGTPPNSIIDNRENGPDLNNVRILQHVAAYDHSGHPIFFSVTGLPSLASFTSNAAGQQALQIAETYNVYEFPRASNPQFAVFPKRQDLIADLRNGYFSNDPLGVWRINLVRFTPAAFNTGAGQQALADIAARNGRDLDNTPLIRTLSEVESLLALGLVSIDIPPMDGSAGFRWFFCPVIEDPRDGAIAPDAFLEVTPVSTADEFTTLFACLQQTGRECEGNPCPANCDNSTTAPILNVADFTCFLQRFAAGDPRANCDNSSGPFALNVADFTCFLQQFAQGCN